MANRTQETSPSILERVRSRVSGWFSPTGHTERQGNTNGNLRRRRESDSETPEDHNEAPPVKKLKSYIVTQSPVEINFGSSISTPTTSGFGMHRNFLDYSNRPQEPYNFMRSTPIMHHPPQKSQLNEVVAEVDEEDADEEPREEQEEDEAEESIANGNDTASESGASMSSTCNRNLRQSSVINFGSHLQSKKSLFSDKNISMSMSSLNSLSQKRSFNASLYGSTSALSDSRLLNIQSPFYRGRTMFGGASAYSRHAFSNPLRSRQMPSTRPSSSLSNISSSSGNALSTSNRDEVPLSNTAKRILEVMNQLSGPLTDVRKMANSSLSRNLPPLMTQHRQRFTEQDRVIRLQQPKTPYSKSPTTRANTVPPLTELQVPSMSQLLQMKKLQSQTEQLRKCAMDSSSSLNRITEYKLPDAKSESDGSKHVNKMRNKITKTRPEASSSDGMAIPVNLPDVQLPQLKSVPTFDITFAAGEKKNGPTKTPDGKSEESKGSTFKFAAPIVIGESGNCFGSPARGCFKFSEPIDITKSKSTSSPPTFMYTAEMAKKSAQNVKEKPVEAEVQSPGSLGQSLKVGSSVLEALKSSPLKSDKGAKATEKDVPKVVSSFGSQFRAPANTWECESCLVRNKEGELKCIACGSAKKGSAEAVAAVKSAPPMDSGFKALLAAQSAKWECTGCMLKNDNALTKCACCEQPRPDGALKTTADKPKVSVPVTTVLKDEKFSNLMKQQKALWECSACMSKNDPGKNKCPCCDQPKPGTQAENAPQFSFSAVPSAAKFTFGMPPVAAEKSEATSSTVATTASFVFGAQATITTKESEKTAKEPLKSGFVFGNVATTTTSADTVTSEPPKFVFGAPKAATTTAESAKFVFGTIAASTATSTATSTASSATVSSTSGFKFGVPTATSSAESSVTPKAPPTFTFGTGSVSISKAQEPPATTVAPTVTSVTSTTTTQSPGTLKASIVFGTPAATTASSSTNLFGGPTTTTTSSPFGSTGETPSQAVFKSPIVPIAPATKAEEPKKPTIEFGSATKTQTFTFGAVASTTAAIAPAAFAQPVVTTSAPTARPAVFTFGASPAAAPEPAKPQQPTFIFGGASAAKPEEKPQPAATPAASSGFQGFGGFGGQSQSPLQSQSQPAFGSVGFGAAPAAATPSPFGSGMSQLNSVATPAFGSSPGFGSSPSTNLFGSMAPNPANAPSVFSASPSTAQNPATGNLFGSVANKPTGSPFGQTRGFDVSDGIEPSSKKPQPSFDFGTPKADSTNTPFNFGANNNNTPSNQTENKPAFNFTPGAAPNFNFTGSAQQNSSQPFSFNATPSTFNFEAGNTECNAISKSTATKKDACHASGSAIDGGKETGDESVLNRHGNRVKSSVGISGKNFGERGMTSRKPSIYRWHCKYPNRKYFKTSQSLRSEEISKEAEGSAGRRIAGQRIYRMNRNMKNIRGKLFVRKDQK
ncbi:nuclear pore complex protein Nup153 isoform X2 [Phlebotomus papatasi]|uniref:nuclear pore complex protein Nup153 isoform X2 n=1 Tax=Phlebotomus papatasi TaxID=29031 RepID=UPI00248373C9|nr:nuclear pore complex protein Nup153 isoform X2 [Phlebotomus papatasi]